jgi:hypothetical protein
VLHVPRARSKKCFTFPERVRPCRTYSFASTEMISPGVTAPVGGEQKRRRVLQYNTALQRLAARGGRNWRALVESRRSRAEENDSRGGATGRRGTARTKWKRPAADGEHPARRGMKTATCENGPALQRGDCAGQRERVPAGMKEGDEWFCRPCGTGTMRARHHPELNLWAIFRRAMLPWPLPKHLARGEPE